MIKTREEVEAFLGQFFPKFSMYGIYFLDRQKNTGTLEQLSMTTTIREEIVRGLVAEDYVETIENTQTWGEMWVFGKDYSGTELYIKISLGQPEDKTICISFHTSKYPIEFAFK